LLDTITHTKDATTRNAEMAAKLVYDVASATLEIFLGTKKITNIPITNAKNRENGTPHLNPYANIKYETITKIT
jgi:hypothetical protein